MLYLTITPYKKYNYLPKFKFKTLTKSAVIFNNNDNLK